MSIVPGSVGASPVVISTENPTSPVVPWIVTGASPVVPWIIIGASPVVIAPEASSAAGALNASSRLMISSTCSAFCSATGVVSSSTVVVTGFCWQPTTRQRVSSEQSEAN